jgi:hypothetical protein
MKKYLSIVLVSSVLYSTEVDTSTALDSLVLKAGITALINDFEREKNITKQHSDDIEELKQNVKFLMEQSLKSKFSVESNVQNTPISNNTDLELESLKEENKKLREYIEELKELKTKVILNTNQAKVIHEKASLKSAPFQNANRTRFVYFADILDIEECNKYGWCKLANTKEYIPKYKLRFE